MCKIPQYSYIIYVVRLRIASVTEDVIKLRMSDLGFNFSRSLNVKCNGTVGDDMCLFVGTRTCFLSYYWAKISESLRGLSQLLHDRMRPKSRASEEIRKMFYKCSHEKMLVRKHARVEAPVGNRYATICNGSCDMSYVLVRSLCNKSECCTMKRQHRTSNQVIGRWTVR